MRAALVLLACLGGAAALSIDKERPVAKVVRMLKDMKAQLEKEAAEDDEVMDKMVCWCETNDKEKTLAISTNTAKIAQLGENIEEYTAKSQQLEKEVGQLEKAISGNKQELLEATTMRDKDRANFVQEEKEQIVSIKGITDALSALKKKVPGLSMSQKALVQVQQALKKRPAAQRHVVQSFLETKAHQAPASSEILGILKQMKDDFEASLKESRSEEKSAEKAYSELKGAKNGELQAATDQKDAKNAQNAEAMEKLADAKTDLKDTQATLEADTAFLADLKKRCANMDAEFAARKKVRAEETTAVSEALSVLTADESRDAFGATGSFVQVSSRTVLVGTESSAAESKAMARARVSASRLLLSTALKLGAPKLSTLAIRLQADVFAKVKEAIDELVAQLKKESKDEIKQRDWCVKELNQNARQTDDSYHTQHRLQTQYDENDLLLKNGNDEIAADKSAIAEMQVQMKKASENRQQENKDFLITIQDQRATQEILTKALDKLKAFYDPHRAALLQTKQKQPGGFKKYKKSGGAQGVMGMIEGIISESKAVESDAIGAEQDSQAAYEGFIKDTNKSIKTLKSAVAAKTDAVAKADSEIARVKADLLATTGTLEELHNYAGQVHASCDFTLQNFDQRQQARTTEIDALNQAKGIMSGAR